MMVVSTDLGERPSDLGIDLGNIMLLRCGSRTAPRGRPAHADVSAIDSYATLQAEMVFTS
ncbi:hypothetical protein IVB18_32035 [Bradyrhizobium sp. 186]|uniref:hypothetical protein n=1 Tax=Bradyrhizobium sp. 186 TaxID=2782654 RepID=UPI002000F048|nr:hypothetical protein [Bradyrhizobium sp. 186]UPK32855.1 hypothetical protein IVB18_32035 [Bradyrhizobium sp. 186]